MTPEQYLEIITRAAKLKTVNRHCYTEEGRLESVADHSWRVALMAMLLEGEEEFAKTDMHKVIKMCLIHDLGETFTGDIPTFRKTQEDTDKEIGLYEDWLESFPEPQRSEWKDLITEMKARRTPEAKLYKAIDQIEAVIAHDESDLATWLPLEYDLQLTYGQENMKFSSFMKEFRKLVDDYTRSKIGSGTETDRKER